MAFLATGHARTITGVLALFVFAAISGCDAAPAADTLDSAVPEVSSSPPQHVDESDPAHDSQSQQRPRRERDVESSREETPEPSGAPLPDNEADDGAQTQLTAFDGFPDETTTGVPAGTRLQASDSITVTNDGAVIDGLDIRGSIDVRASNVTIRNTRVISSGSYAITFLIEGPRRKGLVVENSELDGNGSADPAIIGDNYVLDRVHIHGFGDGPRIGGENVTITNSYITDLASGNGNHNDGIQMTDGRGVTIKDNHINNANTQTSAVFIGPDFGPISDVVIEGNLLRGGGYTVYAWGTNVRVINNKIKSGYYGARHTGDGVTWQGNVDYETGAPID